MKMVILDWLLSTAFKIYLILAVGVIGYVIFKVIT
jgi:hypothetical protein